MFREYAGYDLLVRVPDHTYTTYTAYTILTLLCPAIQAIRLPRCSRLIWVDRCHPCPSKIEFQRCSLVVSFSRTQEAWVAWPSSQWNLNNIVRASAEYTGCQSTICRQPLNKLVLPVRVADAPCPKFKRNTLSSDLSISKGRRKTLGLVDAAARGIGVVEPMSEAGVRRSAKTYSKLNLRYGIRIP